MLSVGEWQDLYRQAEVWQSNLDFHRDELRFFKRILNRYFILLISDAKLDEMRKMAADISLKENEISKLTADCKTLFKRIGEFIDLESSHNEALLLEEYTAVENEYNEFEASVKELKTLVFNITEHMLESEKLKHLLKA